MADLLPPLLGLEAFEAAARHESFAAAAEELSVSQATVSHRIRSLEAHLGQPLFERLPRGVRLTERGRAYLPAVRDAFEQVLGSTAGVFGGPKQTTLTVRSPVAYNALWLPPLIDAFTSEHPNISITTTSSIFTAMLSAEDVDVEMWLGSGSWPGFDNRLMFDDPFIIVAAPSTRAVLGTGPTLETIADFPIVRLIGSDDHWARLFSQQGLTRPAMPRDLRVDSTVVALGIVSACQSVALAQRRLAEPYLARGELVQLLDIEVSGSERLYLTIPQRSERTKAEAVLFRDWLLERVGPEAQ